MLGKTLSNYRILEKLGAGGQGTAYKAIDSKLGRTVVVKVLPPELTAKKSNLKRFEREARLASSLDHPNICTIFELDEADGLHFIAMQYIDGKNIRQLLGGRPLDLKSALLIAIQVADALAAAHSRGIIHRDIKSGNVMVTPSGGVKVLDFGLAKLLDDSMLGRAGIHQTELTEMGVPYGTATYAAPEQARGDRVDQRADIFSTGVLLYEMLTGTWPFRGKTTIDVRHAVLHDSPKPVAEVRGESIPRSLQQLLTRSLEKDPRDRYQTMVELREALRNVLHEISAVASEGHPFVSVTPEPPRYLANASPVSRAVRWLKSITKSDVSTSPTLITPTPTPSRRTSDETPSAVPEQEKQSLAILPFRNLSNDPVSSFYEFSLADAVITELARVRSLVVRPSSVIARYQGQQVDAREVGHELNVKSVLTAGFMHAGERFRVTTQLLDVVSGEILWSDRIDTSAADIIAVQDTIAQRIVEGLRLELTPVEQVGMTKPSTGNAAAYEQYLRGRDLFARFIFRSVAPGDCAAAIRHFQKAIELDPNFALAHDGLGACYVNRVFKGFGGAEDFERAEQAFQRALAIDPRIVEARMLMVFVYLWRGQKQKAREEVARARREAPDEAVVYFVKATLHRLDGEYRRALSSYDRLVRLDPAAHVVASYNRALVHMYLGNFEEAMRQLDNADEPDNPLVKTFRALALYYTGQTDAASNMMNEVVRLNPNMHGVRPFMALFLSAQGKHEEALAQLTDEVINNAAVDPDIAYAVASVYAVEDMPAEAFNWLARAIRLGNENHPCFENDPNWNSLRADPRFAGLMSKIRRPAKAESGRQGGAH